MVQTVSCFQLAIQLSRYCVCQRAQRAIQLNLYALVPYAYEYVRLATHAGGISGLAKQFARQIAFSGNFKVAALGLNGILRSDLKELMKAYLAYEISRIKSSAKKNGILRSVLLHEVITDMALALNLDWLFQIHI